MIEFRTIPLPTRQVILAFLLLAFVTSGIPLAEAHAHANASFGHSHDQHHQDDSDRDEIDARVDLDATQQAGALHIHDGGAPSLTLILEIDMNACPICIDTPIVTPPVLRPPDNVVTPLYRPPIA